MSAAIDDNPIAAGVMTAFLRTGTRIDHGSSVLMLASVLLYVTGLPAPLENGLILAALMFGIAEKYCAWRVALDAEFFALLAAVPSEAGAFDAALAACLGRMSTAAPRSMQSRWRGAKNLLLRQGVLCALQAVLGLAQLALIAGAN